jgi:hypothetical protein
VSLQLFIEFYNSLNHLAVNVVTAMTKVEAEDVYASSNQTFQAFFRAACGANGGNNLRILVVGDLHLWGDSVEFTIIQFPPKVRKWGFNVTPLRIKGRLITGNFRRDVKNPAPRA